jgi:retron-type reverse transcriptase
MKLAPTSYQWAFESLARLGDSDLFASPPEFSVLQALGNAAIIKLAQCDISSITHGPARRFLVPKDDLSYRTATQLDPLDSIILTALMYQYGQQIESIRRPSAENTVFSNRFSPQASGHMYGTASSWNEFWSYCYENSKKYPFMVLLDIADFYNQIYHHSLENQLVQARLPNQAIKWIISLCQTLTAKVSRGIPLGPHASHLLGELILCAVDNSLASYGITFARYIDDIILFAGSSTSARALILHVASTLDKQQKLMLQRYKTKILPRDKFREYCHAMLEDRPINDLEKELVEIIRKHSNDDPYRTIWLSELSDEELQKFQPTVLEKIIADHLQADEPDYVRLRWFIRRLAQVGHPGAVDVLLREFTNLLPAMSEICRYFLATSQSAAVPWDAMGHNLLEFLTNEIVASNEYYQLCVLSLFSAQKQLDHLPALLNLYQSSSPVLRREIILCAAKHQAAEWLRELKEQYAVMDPWSRRAFLYASHLLPPGERKFFLSHAGPNGPLEQMIAEWSKRK